MTKFHITDPQVNQYQDMLTLAHLMTDNVKPSHEFSSCFYSIV